MSSGRFLPIGSRETKANKQRDEEAIFKTFSIGVNTNRDAWVYCFDKEQLTDQVQRSIETYNVRLTVGSEQRGRRILTASLINDESKLKWSSRLKETFARGIYADFKEAKIRNALYRPFTKRFLFFDSLMNHAERYFQISFQILSQKKRIGLLCLRWVWTEKPVYVGR